VALVLNGCKGPGTAAFFFRVGLVEQSEPNVVSKILKPPGKFTTQQRELKLLKTQKLNLKLEKKNRVKFSPHSTDPLKSLFDIQYRNPQVTAALRPASALPSTSPAKRSLPRGFWREGRRRRRNVFARGRLRGAAGCRHVRVLTRFYLSRFA
jgi:hypothetical protein